MPVKNVYFTFEEVIKEIDPLEPGDLMKWLKVICKFYLTEQDITILDALKARYGAGYKQRELSVLFCMSQPFLSVKFKHIRIKILTLYNFLQSEALIEEYQRSKEYLTARQFSMLRLAMAGNSFYDIARVEKVTNPGVSLTFKTIMLRLEKVGTCPLLVRFLKKYKGKFIKN